MAGVFVFMGAVGEGDGEGLNRVSRRLSLERVCLEGGAFGGILLGIEWISDWVETGG